MPECPRQLRVRNVLCCVLLLLVVVLIYYGSVTYRMPWEAASRGKVRAAHKGSKNGVFYFQEDTRFRKNKSQRQKQKEWKIPSTRFQRNKTRGKKGKKAFMAGAQSADRPSFEVRDKPSRDGGNPWKKNQGPFKTFPALRVKNTMSESEIGLKTTQRPRQKDPILGRNDKNSRKAENPWNRNQVPFLRNQPLELKNKISEYSGKENQMYFQKSQPPELRNKLWQNSELAWKKNQEPFRKDQTLGLKDKRLRNSTIPWRKSQEPFRKDLTLGLRDKLLRNSTIPWKKNQEPFRKDQTVERKDKILRNSVIPWKKNQTQWQEKKTMGSPGIPFSKDKPLDYKDKTAQRPRKLEMPDDWSEFFVPRSQQQFSLKYSYKYPAKDVCKTTPDILVMVLSTPKNRLRRQAIRDTWGSVVRTRTWPGPTPHALPRSFKMVFLLEKRSNLDPTCPRPCDERVKSMGTLYSGMECGTPPLTSH